MPLNYILNLLLDTGREQLNTCAPARTKREAGIHNYAAGGPDKGDRARRPRPHLYVERVPPQALDLVIQQGFIPHL